MHPYFDDVREDPIPVRPATTQVTSTRTRKKTKPTTTANPVALITPINSRLAFNHGRLPSRQLEPGKRSTHLIHPELTPSPPLFHVNKESLYSSNFAYATKDKSLRSSSNKIEITRSRPSAVFEDNIDLKRKRSRESIPTTNPYDSPHTSNTNYKFRNPIKKIFLDEFRDGSKSPKLKSSMPPKQAPAIFEPYAA